MKLQKEEKTAKGDRTRRRILETATALMAEKGPDAVSMRELSARLHITKPVLYYYFKDKDALIRAAFEEGTKHFRELYSEMNRPDLTLERKLERLFSEHLDFIRRYPDMPKCSLKMMASPPGGVLSSLSRNLKQRNRKALRALFAKERFSGHAAEDLLQMVKAVLAYFIMEASENGLSGLDSGLPGRLARLICAGARRAKTLLFLLLLPALAGPARSAVMTLGDAVDLAMKNNVAVIDAEKDRLIYKEKIREYWGGVYPQLSASAQYTRNFETPYFFIGGKKIPAGLNNAYSASLNFQQVLWAGGKVNTGIRMAGLYSDSSAEQLRSAQNMVRKSVTQLYYSVLLSSAMAGIQEETLNLSRQHLDTIRAQFRQGLASDLEVMRQEVEVSNNEPAVTQNRNYYEEGLLTLKKLLGLDTDDDVSLSGAMNCGAAPGQPLADLYRLALLNRPENRLAELQKRLAAQNVSLERSGHYPYLGAFASRQFQAQDNNGLPTASERSWSMSAGVSLNLPLFSGGSVSSRVQQAELALEKSDSDLKDEERGIRIDVKKAWMDLNEASQRLASQVAAVDTARKTLSATELRFKSGLAGQLDLNDATLALNKAQTLYSQAAYDVCSAGAELDWAVGR